MVAMLHLSMMLHRSTQTGPTHSWLLCITHLLYFMCQQELRSVMEPMAFDVHEVAIIGRQVCAPALLWQERWYDTLMWVADC